MTDIDTSEWSPTLQRCARVVGTTNTLKLVRCCGGLENLYIPQTPHDGHVWAQAVGLDVFTVLAQEFGGEHVTLPLLKSLTNKKALIISLIDQGIGTREIALRVRSTPRYVRRVAALFRDHSTAD